MMTNDPPALAVVVPCYNEESVLPETLRQLLLTRASLVREGRITEESQLYFVDDGSRDRTWALIEQFAATERCVYGIKLSRNNGHQNAVLAGLFHAAGDAIVTVDADLQDDIGVLPEMVSHYLNGYDVVYGVRNRRPNDSWFKRVTAEGYYRVLAAMGANVVFNHADCRLMSRRAIDALKDYGEVNLFLRGIVPTIGFPSAIAYYDRRERFAGESKYSLRKMLALAVDGITSFSTVPLRMIAALGLFIFVVSLALSAWVLWIRLFTDQSVPGWASLTLPIYLMSGIQLLSVGILGEYVAKIYMETKRRPRYFVERIVTSGNPVPDARRWAGSRFHAGDGVGPPRDGT